MNQAWFKARTASLTLRTLGPLRDGELEPAAVPLDRLWLLQALLVLIGHVYSLWIAQRTSLRLFGSSRAALRSQLPVLAGMVAFSVFSLWLVEQPMEMRTSAM